MHRYRDSAAAIRGDVLRAFGQWLCADPGTFVQNAYLKYVGWMLNDDEAADVRLQVRRRGGCAGGGAHRSSTYEPLCAQAASCIARLYSLPAVDPARLDEFMTRFRSEKERGGSGGAGGRSTTHTHCSRTPTYAQPGWLT